MPLLEVELTTERQYQVVAGEFSVVARFRNATDEVAYLNVAQAVHPALVLEIRDADDTAVLLRPPDAPRPEQAGRGEPIEPGADVSIEYVGFLDRDQSPDAYRVRYVGRYEPLGGSPDDPLVSDWLDFEVARPAERFERPDPLPGRVRVVEPVGLLRIFVWVRELLHLIVCWILRLLRLERCDRVLTRSIDEARTEVMSNAPPGFEAWNGTYAWRARFRAELDQRRCRMTVTVRIRLVGTITDAQRTAWESAIEARFGNVFKHCCRCCCCRNGYTIVANVAFVTSGEDQVVNVGDSTTNMGNWGRNDTTAVTHEFGHMLGALDEYYTVDGTDWGSPFQPGAGIMNNPNEGPLARHYELVERAAEAMLGTSCSTRAVSQGC